MCVFYHSSDLAWPPFAQCHGFDFVSPILSLTLCHSLFGSTLACLRCQRPSQRQPSRPPMQPWPPVMPATHPTLANGPPHPSSPSDLIQMPACVVVNMPHHNENRLFLHRRDQETKGWPFTTTIASRLFENGCVGGHWHFISMFLIYCLFGFWLTLCSFLDILIFCLNGNYATCQPPPPCANGMRL
jgi:hypothetical protein